MSAARSGRAAAALFGLLLAATAAGLELTPQEMLGKRIFREGRGAAGDVVAARVGPQSVAVSGAALPCAGCHGADGKGRPEGGLRPPEITWQELAKPYGHRHDNGREHPAFEAASFTLAVTEGIDPAGRRLDPAMPRYAMAQSDAAALAAYLRRIGDDHDPGVAPGALRIGTILPMSGPLAEAGAMVEKLLQGAFADINAGGGIHGRRLEVVAIDLAGPLRERLEAAEVFALVAPLAPGRADELAALAEAAGLPVVGPLGGEGGADGRYVFRLAPGEREQARALVEFAAGRLGLADPEVAVVLPEGKPELAAAVEGQLRRHGWTRVSRAAPGLAPAAAVAAWQARGVEAVFHFGMRDGLAALQRAAADAGWQPAFLAPAAQAAGVEAGRLFVALPALPGEGSEAGRRALVELRLRLGLPARQPTLQAAAYAAAAVLAEGLKRAGRAASRARLVDALENLHAFDTGVMPPLAFGPGRRTGVMGAHVLAVDPAAGAWRPAGGFVPLEAGE